VNVLRIRTVLARPVLIALTFVALPTNGCKHRTDQQHQQEASIVSPEVVQLHRVIVEGSIDDLAAVLRTGIDMNAPGRNGNTALMVAIDAHRIDKVLFLLENGADPELSNDFNTTALGLAVQCDFVPAIKLLIENGCDRGYRPKYSQKKIRFDFPIGKMKMPEGLSATMSEAEWKSIMQEGMDSINQSEEPQLAFPLIQDVQSQEALRLFVAAGDRLGEAPKELKHELLGLPRDATFTALKRDFLRDQTQRFGSRNPEPMSADFWNDMVRIGCNGYTARKHYLGDAIFETSGPVWCNDRFGASLTELPDGRLVQIGGEHEDFYDPDFCIYNDVIVFDGLGGFQIYGYSRDAFPPTDFHSATLVGEHVYIVGSLGYPEGRTFGSTPVYRLNTKSFEIAKVKTSGDDPGWISNHLASFDTASNSIRLFAGNVHEDRSTIKENDESYLLNLSGHTWSRIAK